MAVEGRSEGENESEDQAIQIKCHETKLFQTERDSKCRLCKQFDDTVEHIISTCPIIAKVQ
jgi:hypothetical protein